MSEVKRFPVLGLIAIVICLASVVAGSLFAYKYHFRELGKIQSKLDFYEAREERLRNMQLTLLVNYGISPYEARYYSFIYDDFSQKYGIPWEIYPSIVRIESNFNSTAKSPKGAIGLTQVMEATGKATAKKLGIDYKKGETLWNEVHNQVIGFTYLSEGIVEKDLEHGVKRFLGGPAYFKTAKRSSNMYSYIGNYSSSVWREFSRNQFIYHGVASPNAVDKPNEHWNEEELRMDSLFNPIVPKSLVVAPELQFVSLIDEQK